jgi:hypothetical protein
MNRFVVLAAAAMLLLPPAAIAQGSAAPTAHAWSSDYSAAKKKPAKKVAAKPKTRKVEYMRTVPMN